ncbi:MAG: RES domain-containing protein [Anaerolineales bacterium]
MPVRRRETVRRELHSGPIGTNNPRRRAHPHRLGSEWIAHGAAVALRVPSVLIPEEWDIFLNPARSDFSKVCISKPQAFRF